MGVTQQAFATALLDPDMAVPEGLIDPEGRPAGKRFNVYRNNVIVSLMDAMEEVFPVIAKLIGPQNFRNLARVFVKDFPPKSPLLMFYGGDFPGFLEGFAPLGSVPYLADVARLELARRDACHAADTVPVPQTALAAVPPEKLTEARFDLAHALRLVESPYPIVGLWHYNITDGAPKPVAGTEIALITRPGLDVEMQVIGADTAAFLEALQENSTLGQAYEAGLAIAEDFDLSAAIGLMLGGGLISNIKT
ncbi:MAG: putative DNA-binding domain-containing protein [Rhodobacteraceae bacterium]|nr:putative DNA-binding domain-containing protein [Paracoccaceae bacterium]